MRLVKRLPWIGGNKRKMVSSKTKSGGVRVRKETSKNPRKGSRHAGEDYKRKCHRCVPCPLCGAPDHPCELLPSLKLSCSATSFFLFFSPSFGAELLGSKHFCRMVSHQVGSRWKRLAASVVCETWQMHPHRRDCNLASIDASVFVSLWSSTSASALHVDGIVIKCFDITSQVQFFNIALCN